MLIVAVPWQGEACRPSPPNETYMRPTKSSKAKSKSEASNGSEHALAAADQEWIKVADGGSMDGGSMDGGSMAGINSWSEAATACPHALRHVSECLGSAPHCSVALFTPNSAQALGNQEAGSKGHSSRGARGTSSVPQTPRSPSLLAWHREVPLCSPPKGISWTAGHLRCILR